MLVAWKNLVTFSIRCTFNSHRSVLKPGQIQLFQVGYIRSWFEVSVSCSRYWSRLLRTLKILEYYYLNTWSKRKRKISYVYICKNKWNFKLPLQIPLKFSWKCGNGIGTFSLNKWPQDNCPLWCFPHDNYLPGFYPLDNYPY